MFFSPEIEIINNSEKSKFSKGVSLRFFPKLRIFSHVCFFFNKLSKKSLFLVVLGKKECSLDQKSEV